MSQPMCLRAPLPGGQQNPETTASCSTSSRQDQTRGGYDLIILTLPSQSAAVCCRLVHLADYVLHEGHHLPCSGSFQAWSA